MELKPGFKQTEAGVIPEDWETKRLGELFDFTNGRPHEAHLKEGGRFSLITLDSIDINGSLKRTHKQTDAWDNSLRKSDLVAVLSDLAKGDLLGLCDLIPEDNLYVLNQRMGRLRARALVNSYFARLQINSRQSHFKARSQGSAQRHVYRRDFDTLSIPCPSVQEQSSIANALLDIDAMRISLEEIISKKRLIKQAAMQELLTGKRRLPGFEGEWEVKRLGEVAPLQRGFDLPNPQLRPGHYPVVYSNGVLNYHASFQVKGPGIITGRSGTIGKVHFVECDYWPHNTSLWVTDFKRNNPRFIFYLLTQLSLERFATGSGVPTLNRNDVHDYRIQITCDADEQCAIATALSEIDAEIAALEARKDKASDLKQGMLQQLLTGKVRLK